MKTITWEIEVLVAIKAVCYEREPMFSGKRLLQLGPIAPPDWPAAALWDRLRLYKDIGIIKGNA